MDGPWVAYFRTVSLMMSRAICSEISRLRSACKKVETISGMLSEKLSHQNTRQCIPRNIDDDTVSSLGGAVVVVVNELGIIQELVDLTAGESRHKWCIKKST